MTVHSYEQGGTVPFDSITFDDFNDPSTALGPPTMDTTSDDAGFGGASIPVGETVPVVPVYPAFRSFELVSIGATGHLAVAFDHKVLDDPHNPYGLDFIIFGNQQFGGSASWSNRSPDHITLTGSLFPQESGVVSVSQDGTNWLVLPSAPFADHAFAPTLGRVYDPAQVDTNLGSWNLWWAGPTDPTFPVDPDVVITNLTDWTVTELARRYRHSAGGTGYDISSLALPVDPVSGHKWIQYVRVENGGGNTPEIDAFSDIAPVDDYTLWQINEFDWETDPTNLLDHVDPDGDGVANLFEYGGNRDPQTAEPQPLFAMIGVTGMYFAVEYEYNPNATNVQFQVQTTEIVGQGWTTNGVIQELSSTPQSNGMNRITAGVPMDALRGFIRLRGERK